MSLVLLPIAREGTIAHAPRTLDDTCRRFCSDAAMLYTRVGFEPPFVGYIAFDGARYVGACHFATPPHAGRVEIAGHTFPGCEGRGFATLMARALVDIADGLDVIAHTAAESNASTSVLQKVGFRLEGRVSDPARGVLWQWRLR